MLFRSLATGKPEAVVERIVTGKMEKFYEENCLYEQHYIKDEGVTIGEMVSNAVAKLGENITIRRFSRFKVGEIGSGTIDSPNSRLTTTSTAVSQCSAIAPPL